MQLPIAFVNSMRSLLGEEYAPFEAALLQEPSVSIRFNRLKTNQAPESLKNVPWCESGYYLPERPQFTFDPFFHAGYYYVQEASSMFLERVLSQYVDQQVRYLDLCAAPGGKTTLALGALPQGSLVVANEIDRKRANILAENITKWGSSHVVVANNEAADYTQFTDYFDVILTDVPCSGEGMFRKDEQAIEEWSEANVRQCVARQKVILEDIWPALRPGGLLIYSTCTYNVEENEQMIAYLHDEYGAEVLPVEVDAHWGIHAPLQGDLPVYRFMPHTTHGEGLFMAVVRKPEDDFAPMDRSRLFRDKLKKASKRDKTPVVADKSLLDWVAQPDRFVLHPMRDEVVALPKVYEQDMKMLSQHLRSLVVGTSVGYLKGRDYVPNHALAISSVVAPKAFARAELNYDQALTYLRREAIELDGDVPKGMVIVAFEGAPLGFVKNLGNRANNLYPQEWRIRSSYNPTQVWTVGEIK